MTSNFILFAGQGTCHPVHGYGTVHAIRYNEKGRVITATVGFTTGESEVPATSLVCAAVPEAELQLLSAKYAKPEKAPQGSRKQRSGIKPRKKVRCRPDLHVGAKAFHAKGRATILVVGQYLCLVSFRKHAPAWVQPNELWTKRYPYRLKTV
jgi:hypothetical protein